MFQTRISNHVRAFCVVQFIGAPFENIDDYVCVPYTWLILPKHTGHKVLVAYPNNENPSDTRERVKRNESRNYQWRCYRAIIEYESDSYKDAENWIARRKGIQSLVKEKSSITDTPPRVTLNKKLPSANQIHSSKLNDNPGQTLPRTPTKRPALSEPKNQLDRKLRKATQTSSTIVNDTCVEPNFSKKGTPMIIKDIQPVECAQPKATAASSNGDDHTAPRIQTSYIEQNRQTLSLPVIDIDKSTEIINVKDEENLYDIKVSDRNNSINQSHLSEDTTAASMTAAKPLANQTSQPYQHNNQEYVVDVDSSSSNLELRIENVRSLANVHNDHELSVNKVSNNAPSTSHGLLRSTKICDELYSQMDEARRLAPIQKPVKRLCPMNITRNSKITQEIQHVSKINDDRQNSQTQEQYLTRSHQSQYLPTNQNSFKETPLKGSTDSNKYDHRTTTPTTKIRTPAVEQSVTSSLNLFHHTSELPQQRQSQPYQKDLQQQPQRPKLSNKNRRDRVGTSIKPKNKIQPPTLQSVTKKTSSLDLSLSKTLSKLQNLMQKALNEQELPDHRQLNHTGVTTSPRNIAASAASDKHISELPSCSYYQPPRIQHTTTQENVHQNLRTQEQLISQSTTTNSKLKRVHFEDNTTNSAVNESYPNVMSNAYQTDECLVEPLSPNYAVTSDSDEVTDHEVISEHETSTSKYPIVENYDVNSTGFTSVSHSADKLTVAQNSKSPNHQTLPRYVLEQQMLDNFATVFTQMGVTLRYTSDMYNKLRSLMLDTSESYKKLLGAVKRFNAATKLRSDVRNSASNLTNNVQAEVPHVIKERHTADTARASSSNGKQHNNNYGNASKEVKQKHNNLWRFVLPPEYDPDDTRWTLKYRTHLPGLVEIKPQSGIYVSYGDLKYCQVVSKNCESLARKLLLRIFNRTALSVCMSMSEKMQDSNNIGPNVRPQLDQRASSVLLNFVLDHGLERGWNTDIQLILSALHSKIQEIRFKYGLLVKC